MGRVEQERSARGNEFQIVGAAKVNERQPIAERMSGTLSKCLSRDRKFLEGTYGIRNERKAQGRNVRRNN